MKNVSGKTIAMFITILLCSTIVGADTIVDTTVEYTDHTFTDPTLIDNSTVYLNHTENATYGNFTGDVTINNSAIGGNWLSYLIFENANVTIEDSTLFNVSIQCYNSSLSIINTSVDAPIAKDRRIYALEMYNSTLYILNTDFISSNGIHVEDTNGTIVLSSITDAESYAIEAFNSTINLDGVETEATFGYYVENSTMNATVLDMDNDEMMLQALDSEVDIRRSNIQLRDEENLFSITSKNSRVMTSSTSMDFRGRNGMRVTDSSMFFYDAPIYGYGSVMIDDHNTDSMFINDRPQMTFAPPRGLTRSSGSDNSTVTYGVSTSIRTIFDPLVAEHIVTYYLSGVPVTIESDGNTYNFTTNESGFVESRAILGESIGWDDDIIRRTERDDIHNTPIIVSYTINETDLKVKDYNIEAEYEGNTLSRSFSPREGDAAIVLDFGDYVKEIPKDTWTFFSIPLEINITTGYLIDALEDLGYNMKVITIFDATNNRYIPIKAGGWEERDYIIDAFTILMFYSDEDYLISFKGDRRDSNIVEIDAGHLKAVGLSHEMSVQDIYSQYPEIQVITYFDSEEKRFVDLKESDDIYLNFGTVLFIVVSETVTVSL